MVLGLTSKLMIGNAFGCIYLWSSEIYPTIVRLVNHWNSASLTNKKCVAQQLKQFGQKRMRRILFN